MILLVLHKMCTLGLTNRYKVDITIIHMILLVLHNVYELGLIHMMILVLHE